MLTPLDRVINHSKCEGFGFREICLFFEEQAVLIWAGIHILRNPLHVYFYMYRFSQKTKHLSGSWGKVETIWWGMSKTTMSWLWCNQVEVTLYKDQRSNLTALVKWNFPVINTTVKGWKIIRTSGSRIYPWSHLLNCMYQP